MSERYAGEGDLEWAGVIEECKKELSCVLQDGPSKWLAIWETL